jgi:hypothetical protein
MKLVLLLLILFVLPPLNKANSQTALVINVPEETPKTTATASNLPFFEFRTSLTEQQISEISDELAETHELGKMVSKKFYLLDSKYTYEMPLVPGNPQSKTMVRKPVVYESVYKIEKYLKKSVKKGEISLENATTIMNKVLDVANCILTVDTSSFEKEIDQRKNPQALTQLFMNQVKLVN